MSGPAPISQADNAFVLNDPNLERTFRGHKNYVTSVCFSPSMKQLASGAGDDTVFLWSFKPQLRAFRFMGHRGVVTDVCFSPEGDVLASASKDRTVRLWVPSAKGESVTMKGHTGAVRSVQFSPDSKYLVTASDDKTAKVWSLPSRKFAASLVSHSNWVRSAAFDCTSKLVVTGSDDTSVKLWDVSSPNPLHTFTDHNDAVLSTTFTTVRYWPSVLLASFLLTPPGHHLLLSNQDGSCVVSGGADCTLKMWDIRSHQLVQHYSAHAEAVTSVSAHPSGYYLLSSSRDASTRIWDLRAGRLLFTLSGHDGAVNAASFSRCGNFFSTGGADQMVLVWRANLVGVAEPHQMEALQKRVATGTALSRETGAAGPTAAAAAGPRGTARRLGTAAADTAAARSTAPVKSPKATTGHVPGLPKAPTTAARAMAYENATSSPMSPKNTYREKVRNQQSSASSTLPDRAQVAALAPRMPLLQQMQQGGRGDIPEKLASTLDHIVGQLDIITRTMSILESRLTLTEDRVSTIIAHTRGLQEVPASPLPHARTTQFVATSYGGSPVDTSYMSSGREGGKPFLALSPGMSFLPSAAETSVLRSTGPVTHLVAPSQKSLGSLGALQREQGEDETAENEAHARDELQRLALAANPTEDSCFEDDRNAQMAIASRTRNNRSGMGDLSRTLVDGDVEGKDGEEVGFGDDDDEHIIVGEEEGEYYDEEDDDDDDDNVEDVDMGKH